MAFAVGDAGADDGKHAQNGCREEDKDFEAQPQHGADKRNYSYHRHHRKKAAVKGWKAKFRSQIETLAPES